MTMLELNHEFLNILQNVLKVFFPPLMSPVPKYGATASNCNLFSHHSYCLCPKNVGKGPQSQTMHLPKRQPSRKIPVACRMQILP